MPTTLRNTDILFNDSTAQSTAWPGIYTGSTSGNTAYPIGTNIIIGYGTSTVPNIAATTTQFVFGFGPSVVSTNLIGTVALAGTWRSRGAIEYISSGTTVSRSVLSQRVA